MHARSTEDSRNRELAQLETWSCEQTETGRVIVVHGSSAVDDSSKLARPGGCRSSMLQPEMKLHQAPIDTSATV